ncbi:MAG: hypothetical protein KDA49_09400 [Rhodospirillaceae bacterium]|nr:hypothetical protein [Rhodospirillaceae bacterium]MCA8932670.1 hypothetical protein [Rhodospirillaceae bacterium]
MPEQLKDSLDRERLEKLLGLMSSPHDGEALAAARKADALVRSAKLTWAEVLAGPPRPNQYQPPHANMRKESRWSDGQAGVPNPPAATLRLSDQEVIDALLASERVPARLKSMVQGYAQRMTTEGLSRDDRAHLRNLYAKLRP